MADHKGTVLYMAPMQGVTSAAYRNEYSRHFDGYDYAMSPYIKTRNANRVKIRGIRDILPEKNNARFKLIPQILSKTSKDFITLAKGMFDLGYETVNWNLGCPLARIRKKMRGSGLLPFTEKILEFLNKVIPAIPNQVSLKLRLGSEDSGDIFNLLPPLNDLPLKEIIIHPRTGKQMYDGTADVSSFEKSLSLTRHSVVYNGDIDSFEKYEYLAGRFPSVSRWMIGRGGIVDPFLPEEIKALRRSARHEKLSRYREFHNAVFVSMQKELSGPGHLLGKMKEYWRYWSKAFEEGDRLFLTLSRTKNVNKYLSLVEKFFRGKPGMAV
ncbi:tRNA-dihydrouridine synthase [Candidatus Omnitrophota bacterium]